MVSLFHTDAMLIASFNYEPPPAKAIIVGVVLGLLVLALAGLLRRVLVGVLATSVGWASIAWVICGQGRGDLTGLIQIFDSCVAAIAGAVIGGLTAYVSKRFAKRGIS